MSRCQLQLWSGDALRAAPPDGADYDDFEVERVVKVELNPLARQADLIAAVEPVASRIVHAFSAAKQAWVIAEAQGDERAKADAKDHMEALVLLKGDMATFQRLYSFLSQILDYENTEIEKRAIFYRRLLPLLELGREREGIDLSGVKLTHHSLKAQAERDLLYGEAEAPKLKGMSEAGSGMLQEKDKARLEEIIARVNDLFEGQITDDDQLHYVNGFLKSHMLASAELQVQAMANTRAQFDNSPTLQREFLDAVMDADAAFDSMSRQVLASDRLREELLKILLGPVDLYGELRRKAGANEPSP